MVRDLAYEAGKEAILQVAGAETGLDKRILEQIKDPLLHMLRNAVDHGIERPDDRVARGKPRHGTITLTAEQIGQEVVIKVADDGRGLDLDAIRRTLARRQGDEVQELTQTDLEQAIFNAGVSTSPTITDLSGRGVGLDVVRRNVETLHGRIELDWHPGEGTTFILTLPLALSNMRGLLVNAGGERFVIPLHQIERMLPLDWEQVTRLGGHDALDYQGRLIPLARLADILAIPEKRRPPEPPIPPIVIVAAGEQRTAFIVDALTGEQEIVNKGLGRQIERISGLAGATVLGNGEIVLVLHIGDLIQMALLESRQALSRKITETLPAVMAENRRWLLIVDDSITTRALEKNILEAAGYRVQLATNGQEAWDLLASIPDMPELVISDVSMPRMDGIALTRKIKSDSRTAQLPVILVTSLDSPQDKARGIEAGADAYISKGTFDQSNLLDTVEQLI
jgi:two-component system chemotaxis sensor kinase CheA